MKHYGKLVFSSVIPVPNDIILKGYDEANSGQKALIKRFFVIPTKPKFCSTKLEEGEAMVTEDGGRVLPQ